MLCATLVAFLSFSVAGAFADAGNPILNTVKYSAVDNNDGTVTISVRGQWNWLSHNNDCNDDRAATGVGIIWNDLNGPGTTRGANEVQTVTISGAAGGTFKLKFDGDTTNSIAFNASAATVQSELEALSSIGVGDVAVSGGAGGPYTVSFQGGARQGGRRPDDRDGQPRSRCSHDLDRDGHPRLRLRSTTATSSSNGAISAYVGHRDRPVAGAVTNPLDQMVHPVDRGNVPEGYTTAGTDYPAGQQIVDPTPPEPGLLRSVEGRLRPVAADGDGLEGSARREIGPDVRERHHGLLGSPVGLVGLREDLLATRI